MSSLEGNKIAAAILVGGMITLSVGIATDFIYRPHHEAQAAHEGGAEGGAEPAAKPAAAPLEPVLGLIATADAAKGEAIAKKCESCHTFTADGKNKVGPGLYGVVGRMAGTHPDFAYSEPMKAHGKPWTFADLNHFIARPKEFVPGTKMTFPGLPKVQDRADLLAWLDKQSASPAPLPTPEEIAAEEAALKSEAAPAAEAAPAEGAASGEAAAPAVEAPAEGEQTAAAPAAEAPAEGEQTAAAPAGDNAVAMIASADPAAGEKVATKCKACHDFSNAAKNKVGPALWGVVGRNHASVEGYAYSDPMKGLAGKPWTFEDLDHFLTKPKEYLPGTKMTFPGLPKPADRAALLRWLRDQSDSPAPLPQ
jgi:cytochrome c